MLSLILGCALALAGPQWGSLEEEADSVQWGSLDDEPAADADEQPTTDIDDQQDADLDRQQDADVHDQQVAEVADAAPTPASDDGGPDLRTRRSAWGSLETPRSASRLAVIQRPEDDEEAPDAAQEDPDVAQEDPDAAEEAMPASEAQAEGAPTSAARRGEDPGPATDSGAALPPGDESPTPVAQDGAPEPDAAPGGDATALPGELPPKPRRGKMEEHPYGQTDFTAYTLEWGEWRIRPATVSAGILPRVQVGTAPGLWALQVRNVHAKWNLLRLGPIDLAASGTAGWVPHRDGLTDDGFEASYRVIGGHASVQIAGGWSLHAAARYHQASFAGIPDPVPGLQFASRVLQVEIDQGMYDLFDEVAQYEGPSAQAEALTTEVALDFRFNRRDSFLFRLRWTPWVAAGVDFGEVPPPEGFEGQEAFKSKLPVAASYVASFSYQLSWRHWGLRLGVGQSAVPYLWVVPAFGISYRWGGPTRRAETKELRAWRKQKRAWKRSRR